MRTIKCLILGFGLCLGACQQTEYIPSDAPRTQSKSEKRGVSYDFAGYPDEDMSLLSPGISWFYNWGITLNNATDHSAGFYDLSYFPMVWGKYFNAEQLRKYKAAHPECRYLLTYNEPNLTDQANMTPQEAAAEWPKLLEIAKELDMQIVSPAMNYGTLSGYGDPIVWLDEFFSLINPDDIYAISVHCYMNSTGALKSYINRFAKYGKPIWLTEFCAWDNFSGRPKDQMNFMSEAVCYLELDPTVERYAWFIPKGGNKVEDYPYMYLLTKELPFRLTDCGEVYVGMSTLDDKAYALAGQKIEAEHFTNANVSDWLGKDGYMPTVHFRPTTDVDGGLDIYDFTEGKWVEYQIELSEAKSYQLELRILPADDTELTIYWDGHALDFLQWAESEDWSTHTSYYTLPAGKHTIRLEAVQGNICINWLKIE